MGPSGSGKSTLMSCAAGLESKDSGRVFLNGTDISTLSDDQLTRLRRSDIGFVFQQFNLVAALTAQQNVSLPLRLAGDSRADSAARDALKIMGLAEHIDRKPRELSGGQQQRVAIARALATQPSIVFADEPTGALDSSSAAVVLALLRELVDRGQTILMVTHDPRAASRADHVAFLRDGRLVRTLNAPDAAQIASALTDLELAP